MPSWFSFVADLNLFLRSGRFGYSGISLIISVFVEPRLLGGRNTDDELSTGVFKSSAVLCIALLKEGNDGP